MLKVLWKKKGKEKVKKAKNVQKPRVLRILFKIGDNFLHLRASCDTLTRFSRKFESRDVRSMLTCSFTFDSYFQIQQVRTYTLCKFVDCHTFRLFHQGDAPAPAPLAIPSSNSLTTAATSDTQLNHTEADKPDSESDEDDLSIPPGVILVTTPIDDLEEGRHSSNHGNMKDNSQYAERCKLPRRWCNV